MKKIFYITGFILFISCNKENVNDCFQTAGEIIQQEMEVSLFDKIVVHKNVELIITQGIEQKVVVETGKNLLSDIRVQVIDNELILINNNTCNNHCS